MSQQLKCSPIDMSKNLQIVDTFRKAGIDFVPIPAKSAEHKSQLEKMLFEILEQMGDCKH